MDAQTIIAVIAIFASSTFSGIAIFLNYLVVRKSNRLIVAGKYSEMSKIISEEKCIRVDIIRNLKERFPKQTNEQKEAGEQYISKERSRLQELDEAQNDIMGRFSHLSNDDPAEIEQHILVNYDNLASAKRTLSQMEICNA